MKLVPMQGGTASITARPFGDGDAGSGHDAPGQGLVCGRGQGALVGAGAGDAGRAAQGGRDAGQGGLPGEGWKRGGETRRRLLERARGIEPIGARVH